mmetsp:Transcript_71972/g.100018  ORF Transcript_71972/g.100018 Transcript_71972/m.100018 type:complete len:84 (-) Transcript_71972:469-720(-)
MIQIAKTLPKKATNSNAGIAKAVTSYSNHYDSHLKQIFNVRENTSCKKYDEAGNWMVWASSGCSLEALNEPSRESGERHRTEV